MSIIASDVDLTTDAAAILNTRPEKLGSIWDISLFAVVFGVEKWDIKFDLPYLWFQSRLFNDRRSCRE